MAKKEPTKPDEVKTAPATATPTEETRQPEQPLKAGGEHTPPEMTAGEPATQAQEAGAVLGDKGEEQPAPIDIGGEHRLGDDVIVSFDKINEIISEKKAAAKTQEDEQPAPEKNEPEAPVKKTGRGRTPKTAPPRQCGALAYFGQTWPEVLRPVSMSCVAGKEVFHAGRYRTPDSGAIGQRQ